MLDTDTKRRIDTARDILVGKVPDPKSQVEQITIALIYKFMDDMDAEAEELGGKRKFFSGDYSRYGWAKVMRSGLGGHETLNLYAESIAKMPENPGIPPLFRDIFKNAYLPYRDPETLRAFLKIIDEFTYDHSERLGDAFEYLLSVLGSQGDAGQFRTPRHIIDFIVEVVDPRKTDVILDPACGTAGFLISAYKHIRKANTDADGHNTLTPDERGRLAANFKGYDISPDMVRLSLVNLYLHGFTEPHIFEYDTLTSQDRWNEHADVILANPPFMSPKGGIKPHNRFSVQSKRSEVLFVDYMAEHLTPSGRAGIIVPEGIIFQSQTAYTQLRKMLVEEYLVAVVSLPAGVFNPYSGVKTSILILDRSLAKQTPTIAFFKIENDGFGLGAQRREIAKNDLPQARVEIAEYLRRLRARESMNDFQPTLGLVVPKEKIVANGDYNLSGERYRVGTPATHSFPVVTLGEVCPKITDGSHNPPPRAASGELLLSAQNVFDNRLDLSQTRHVSLEQFMVEDKRTRVTPGDVLLTIVGTVGRCLVVTPDMPRFVLQRSVAVVGCDQVRLIPVFLARLLQSDVLQAKLKGLSKGVAQMGVYLNDLRGLEIPLPPLDVQKEIVAEIEGYQKVIDGARAVLDNYRPHIPIDPDWPMVELGEVADFTSGFAFKSTNMTTTPTDATFRRVVKIGNVRRNGELDMADAQHHAYSNEFSRFVLEVGDVVMAMTGATVGKVAVVREDGLLLNQRVGVLRAKPNALQSFVFHLLCSAAFYDFCQRTAGGGAQGNIAPSEILQYQVPLPPMQTQRAIVAEIEAEQALVNANRDLIARMEKKIQSTLARVWGDYETLAVDD